MLSREPAVVLGRTASGAGPITPSPVTLNGPRGAAWDPVSGALVVADTGHHRVLVWRSSPTADGTPADVVIGQPDFFSSEPNGDGPANACSFEVPTGVVFADGALVVADAWNHRVLIWRSVPRDHNQPADVVLGQHGFHGALANRGGPVGPDTLHWPYGVAWADGHLFVADTGNRRVLVWKGLPEEHGRPADLVLGQGAFDERDEGAGEGPGPLGMRWPHGVAFAGGYVLVADAGCNRIMAWRGVPEAPGAPCAFVLGQATSAGLDDNRGKYWPDDSSLNMPYAIAATAHWFIAADTANSRLLGWRLDALGPDAPATALAGQPNFAAKGANRWKPVARDSLCWPYGLTAAGDTVVVADSGNNRVLVWPVAHHVTEHVAIRVRGIVQGVGYRPTVWRIAHEEEIAGEVCNDGSGVLIRAAGTPEQVRRFVDRLHSEPPPLAQIDGIEVTAAEPAAFEGFSIVKSEGGKSRTGVSPDAATCAACRAEVEDPFERRYRYPFTNCTHCGPRFTIVQRVPYDRARTTMASFPMCAECAQEYGDPADRRYHAQPIACHACGPRAWLARFDGSAVPVDGALDDVDAVATLIGEGHVVAIKGLGGFHLACDATNAEVVERLRDAKKRYAKPFALMARDLDVIRRYCSVSDAEAGLLESPAAPIVLLETDGEALPEAVAPGLHTLGFMLPYTPLHQLIFGRLDMPVVMTSGNVSDEPQVIDDGEAADRLAPLAEFVLLHDRRIANRADDSVVRVVAGAPRKLRRARGYAPRPMELPPGFGEAPPLLAYGGELKATFCLVRDGQAIVSQHQGDLEDVSTYDDYLKNLGLYAHLFDHDPELLVADMHPEYLSTKLARQRAAEAGLPLILVQHHHAHVAGVMAENGVPVDAPPVLGMALDGLGYGDDGTIWGGELLLADYAGYRRLGAFKPVGMLGGAQAIREPWRNTYAHLAEMGWERFDEEFGSLELCRWLAERPRAALDSMLASGVGTPLASSCGRLFDAVAAAVGFCRAEARYEGHAAVLFEAAMLRDPDERAYPFAIANLASGLPVLEPLPMWEALLADLLQDTPAGVISARFHRGLSSALVAMARQLSESASFDTVALSGGCFQNRVLLEQTVSGIEEAGFRVLTNARVPANDGGISLGQAAIAAARALGRG